MERLIMSDDFSAVKDRINFADYVARHLPVKGHKTLCIWHADKTPSLHVYADHCHCFQCQKRGDIFDFAMQFHHWTRQEALIELAREAGVTLTPLLPANKAKYEAHERLYACLEAWAAEYQRALYLPFGAMALKYLHEVRGLTDDTIRAARIGYAAFGAYAEGFSEKDNINSGMWRRDDEDSKSYEVFRNRIMFPMFDHKGRVVGFSGRDMGEKGPKYKNTGETELFHKSQILYGISSDKGTTSDLYSDKVKVCVEGHMCVISAHNRGFKNVYAQMGTALSDTQLNLLCKGDVETIILCLDKDKAGDESMRRSILAHAHTCADKGVLLKVMHAPHGKDPDDTFREHPELWQPAVDAARPAIDVLIEQAIASLPQNATSIDKQKVAQSMIPLLKGSNALLQEDSLKALAHALGYTVETMMAWTNKQPDLRILSPVKSAAPLVNITQMELTVLHGILTNDDQRWIDRANVSLARLNDQYPNALQPLSRMDFSSQTAYDFMAIIELACKGERPIDGYMHENTSTGPLSEMYWRAFYQPKIQAMVNVNASQVLSPLDYVDFIRACITLRRIRLERDVSLRRIDGSLLAEFVSCKLFLGRIAL